MDYVQELKKLEEKKQEIIKLAEKEGYKYINNELINKTYVPVIEIYARGETQYESSGYYHIFKKIMVLTSNQLKEIKELNLSKENLVEFLENGFIADIKELDDLYEILSLCNSGFLEEDEIEYIVEKDYLKDRYYLNSGQKLYLEFFFSSEKHVDGYISVYDMPVNDFEKQDNINLSYRKYLRDN